MFALHTGLRLNEIWQLDSKSVGEEDGIKFINVKTAKQKGGVSKYRQIPLHKNIEHLADLKWLEQIKKGKESSDYFGKRLKGVSTNLSQVQMLVFTDYVAILQKPLKTIVWKIL